MDELLGANHKNPLKLIPDSGERRAIPVTLQQRGSNGLAVV